MKRKLLLFTIKLVVSLLIIFGLHVFVLKQMQYDSNYQMLVYSYIINFLLVLFIVVVISIYIHQLKSYIGFLFMFGSLLKFAVFFIWFYPIIKMDGTTNFLEFSLFFIPYLVGLILETIELSVLSKDT